MNDHQFSSFQKKVFISKQNRLIIFKKIHDQSVSKHSEIRRIFVILHKIFHWSRMRTTVKQYVKNCHECQKTKVFRNKYVELLQFLFFVNQLWIDLSLNFVMNLSINQKNNAILMIIDRFFKMKHLISCITEKHETTVEKIVKLLIKNVWKLHELFFLMISNCDF